MKSILSTEEYFDKYRLILASSSPRRKDILSNACPKLKIEIIPPTEKENLDVSKYENNPWLFAEQTAKKKALEVLEHCYKQSSKPPIVFAADTIISFENKILGKPKDRNDAFRTLSLLNGKSHSVTTGVCLAKLQLDGTRIVKVFHQSTIVHFDLLNNETISEYVSTGEPLDKAGSYGIQAIGGIFVKAIEGDYYNVVGLPLNRFCKELTEFIETQE